MTIQLQPSLPTLEVEDPYLSDDIAFARLWEDYKKHEGLVVAVDFDNVIHDIHRKGFTFPKLITLIRDSYEIGFKIVIYTAGHAGRHDEIHAYLKQSGIPYHTLNEQVVKFKDGFDRSRSKLYYNVFLDDRAGLASAYKVLRRVVDKIFNEKN